VHNGSGTATFYTNGVQNAQGTLNNPNSVTRANNFLGVDNGGTLLFQGEIAEIFVYNQAVTAANRNSIETYLFNRYHLSVHNPVISPAYGCFSSTQSVTITGDTGASLYYTTDGSTPTTSSTLYTGSFNVSTSTTVKAIAVQSWATSSVVTSYVQIDSTATFTKNQLQLWLKADNDVTQSSNNVSFWQDMIGNNSAIQNTSGAQPQYVSSAIAGLPAISFNGSSQFLQLTPAMTTSFTSGATIFLVAKPTAVTTNARFLDFGNGATSDNILLFEPTNTGVSFQVYNGSTGGNIVTSSSAVTLNQYQLVEAEHNGNLVDTAQIYTNGVQGASGTSNSFQNVNRNSCFLGTNYAQSIFYQGQIAELLVYSRPLSAGERTAVETYLFERYQLAVHPPTISPSYGVYTNTQSVTITADANANIYYTLDGSTPTTSSTLYTGAFNISSSTTIKAIAVQTWATSTVTTAYLQIDPSTLPVLRGSSMYTWLKSDNDVMLSGSNVNQWNDMSSNATNTTQTSSSNQPGYVSSDINGLPGVSFNGTSQFLQFGSNFSNFSGGMGIFAVCKPTGTSTGTIFDLSNGASSANVTLSRSSTSGATPSLAITRVSTTTLSASNAFSLGQYQLLEATQNSLTGTTAMLVNGVQKTSSTTMNSPLNSTRSTNNLGSNYSGTTSFYLGNIAEMFIYNTLLTVSQQAALEAYLIQRYQLNSVVPPAPVISVAGATLSGPTQVAIATNAPNTVYYTTDGTTPTTSSNVYTGPINVYYSLTLKAIAVRDGVSSSVSSASYTLDSTQWPAPSATDTTPLNINLQLPTTALP
jgi:hypothetical protein